VAKKEVKAVQLPVEGDFRDLAWAPTGDANIIAANRVNADGTRDLCLLTVLRDKTDVSCITTPGLLIDRDIRWNPKGGEIIASGVKAPAGQGIFGIARWRTKKDRPKFSGDAKDWSKGKFVSDIERPTKGVLDAAISPDGERLAIVSNQGSSFFRLWFADKDDYLLTAAKATSIRACKVTWRGDGQEVIVVQADAGCQEPVGALVRLSPDNTRQHEEVNAKGNDPVYQPPTTGG
jgi:hypothetical protein